MKTIDLNDTGIISLQDELIRILMDNVPKHEMKSKDIDHLKFLLSSIERLKKGKVVWVVGEDGRVIKPLFGKIKSHELSKGKVSLSAEESEDPDVKDSCDWTISEISGSWKEVN